MPCRIRFPLKTEVLAQAPDVVGFAVSKKDEVIVTEPGGTIHCEKAGWYLGRQLSHNPFKEIKPDSKQRVQFWIAQDHPKDLVIMIDGKPLPDILSHYKEKQGALKNFVFDLRLEARLFPPVIREKQKSRCDLQTQVTVLVIALLVMGIAKVFLFRNFRA